MSDEPNKVDEPKEEAIDDIADIISGNKYLSKKVIKILLGIVVFIFVGTSGWALNAIIEMQGQIASIEYSIDVNREQSEQIDKMYYKVNDIKARQRTGDKVTKAQWHKMMVQENRLNDIDTDIKAYLKLFDIMLDNGVIKIKRISPDEFKKEPKNIENKESTVQIIIPNRRHRDSERWSGEQMRQYKQRRK